MSEQTFSVRDKRVVVVGAARSGVAAAELLVRRGARVTLTDRKPEPEIALDTETKDRLRAAGVTLELGRHDDSTFSSADLIVLSPGVPTTIQPIQLAKSAGVPVTGELELASRWLRGRMVAITGTKGKSTTTTLIGRMLEAGGHRVLVGGNIGIALSTQVEASTDDTLNVIETSSFQLQSTDTFHPWIAVLLNFSPDHLDQHASVEEYASAKARIFAQQSETDWAVLNADDPAVLALAQNARARRMFFSMTNSVTEGIVLAGDTIVRKTADGEQPLMPLSSVKLLGRHLIADVLAAAAVASIAGVDSAAMTRVVEGFTGLEHALEPVTEIAGVRFVNDSKATNIEAARRAIESFDDGVVVVLGGRFKGGDFKELMLPLAERHATVIAIGESRPLIREALSSVVSVHEADDMSAAVRTAFASASPGGTVVLAPACSSFDMFRDYAERGRVFKQEVRKLQEEWSTTREQ